MNIQAPGAFLSEWPPNQSWWTRDFPNVTNNGTTPYLFKGVLPRHLHGSVELASAFRTLQERHTSATPARARIYVDEDRHDDMVAKALNTKFEPGETVESFLRRVTGAEKFCVVINNLETLSEPLAAEFGDFLWSMFRVRGVPIGGCEQVAFAGNYAGTPFGVHEGYEHAFLTHLGPGNKDFFCWSQADYIRLTGGRAPTFGDYEFLLVHAEHFIMEPGDILYLPALVYHVGRQTEFSISVAIPLYTYPQKRFLAKAILPALADTLPFEQEAISPHEKLSCDSCPLTEPFSTLAGDTFKHWLDSDLNLMLSDRWFRLVSNGGWESTSKEPQASEDFPVESGTRVRLQRPYKFCWTQDNCTDGDIRLYMGGNSVVVRFHPDMLAFFSRLNAGLDGVIADSASRELIAAVSRLRNGLQLNRNGEWT